MPQITKNSAVLDAEELYKEVMAPAPGGEDVVIGAPGDFVLWKTTPDGPVFAGFLTAQEYREKHRKVV